MGKSKRQEWRKWANVGKQWKKVWNKVRKSIKKWEKRDKTVRKKEKQWENGIKNDRIVLKLREKQANCEGEKWVKVREKRARVWNKVRKRG